MNRTITAVFLLLGMASCLTGCFPEYHKARYNVEDRRILVVPFREPQIKAHSWYGWSDRGRKLTQYFKAWVSRDWSPNFVTGEESHDILKKIEDWRSNVIEPREWQRLGRDGDFDLFLIGDLVDFRVQQPEDINVYRGTSSMRYRLIHRRTGRTAFEYKLADPATFGDLDHIPYTVLDKNGEQRIENGLLRELAERLGKDLYGYYEE
jgi:hypothetical protein